MTKTIYNVSMAYCGGHLGTSKGFNRYSDAYKFALKSSEDVDNTDIAIVEYTVTKTFFKKTVERRTIKVFNEQ